jgi:hypothetical protein
VWHLPDVLSCSPASAPQPVSSQARAAAVSVMAMDPVAEMLAAGHSNGLISVWNCSKPVEAAVYW